MSAITPAITPAITAAAAPGTAAASAAGRRAAGELLADSRAVLERARTTAPVPARLALAQVAAIRAAGAVLALRARPAAPARSRQGRRRSSQPSAWDLLARRAPELGEWAAYLAVPVDLGAGEACPDRIADDRVRDAERFLLAAERVVARSGRCGRGAS